MNRKLLAGLAPLLAIAAFAVMAVAAQAAPHWYLNSNILVKKKAVKTAGALSFGNIIPGTTIVVTCKVKDVELLENPASGGPGVDLMRAFKLSGCGPNPCPVSSAGTQGALKVTALKLPWATKLVEVPPIADEIAGIELVFSCKGTGVLVTLSGTLFPRVNPGFLEFNSPATGTLGGATVNGIDNFSPSGINAKNP
ncbi:MAG TPA: hypothetical protein VNX67_06065 [Solirubrobacteraceae bacterium]|nr:hypothetical protein [Solirubrobacteraceae bacterium]